MQPSSAPVAGTVSRDRNVLLLDLSKSMLAPLPDPQGARGERQKIEVARTAVYRILHEGAKSGTPFGLVTFTSSVRVAVPLVPVEADHLPYIENLISLLTPSGRSAIWDAIAVGSDLLRTPDRGVQGNLVLVTDGWDNASVRFGVRSPPHAPLPDGVTDLVPYILPEGSEVNLRIIGIGEGGERDKGVDQGRMNAFLGQLSTRAKTLGLEGAFSFQEVRTGSELFTQMVRAFLDIGYGDSQAIEELHPEELARRASTAAAALKAPEQHGAVARLRGMRSPKPGDAPPAATPTGSDIEVGVLSTSGGAPAYLRDRYGPLGEVVEAYIAGQYDLALRLLGAGIRSIPAVSRLYWEARVQYARGAPVEAGRALLGAWSEAEKLPTASQIPILRRIALLQARVQNDKETETLVLFLDDAEHRLSGAKPAVRERIQDLFGRLMELRGTYQLTRLSGAGDLQDAALKHENAVEDVFSRLQDARLEFASADPAIESALDFIEVCLAELR
jgi:VWA domain-containing protein